MEPNPENASKEEVEINISSVEDDVPPPSFPEGGFWAWSTVVGA
jgi:hypothetical protein